MNKKTKHNIYALYSFVSFDYKFVEENFLDEVVWFKSGCIKNNIVSDMFGENYWCGAIEMFANILDIFKE